jgi:hypothetical protein
VNSRINRWRPADLLPPGALATTISGAPPGGEPPSFAAGRLLLPDDRVPILDPDWLAVASRRDWLRLFPDTAALLASDPAARMRQSELVGDWVDLGRTNDGGQVYVRPVVTGGHGWAGSSLWSTGGSGPLADVQAFISGCRQDWTFTGEGLADPSSMETYVGIDWGQLLLSEWQTATGAVDGRADPGGLLTRIDRTIDGLCPCGAEPREGSAYCGDDCVPNHRGHNTDDSGPGTLYATPMRWQPDLVSAVDDTGLHDLGSNTFYEGSYHARMFQRGAERDGAVTWHMRLDDGYRFVGSDLSDVRELDDALRARVAAKWAALTRELENPRHAEPVQDDLHSWHSWLPSRSWHLGERAHSVDFTLPAPYGAGDGGAGSMAALGQAFSIAETRFWMDHVHFAEPIQDGLSEQPSGLARAFEAVRNGLRRAGILPRPAPDDPREPRRVDPRRSR